MSRSLEKTGVEIVEVITVFDANGDEVTGLVNADFDQSVTKDGAVSAVLAVVSEINAGTRPGEYKVSFTPTSAGQWRVRLEQSSGSAYNRHGWDADYNVTTDGILSLATIAAGVLAVVPTAAAIAAAVWAYVVETGFSARRMLRIVAGLLAGGSSGGLVNVTVRDLSDSENIFTGSADANGNRTPGSYGG